MLLWVRDNYIDKYVENFGVVPQLICQQVPGAMFPWWLFHASETIWCPGVDRPELNFNLHLRWCLWWHGTFMMNRFQKRCKNLCYHVTQVHNLFASVIETHREPFNHFTGHKEAKCFFLPKKLIWLCIVFSSLQGGLKGICHVLSSRAASPALLSLIAPTEQPSSISCFLLLHPTHFKVFSLISSKTAGA